MGRARTITRRSLLVGATAIAGGVAFGAYVVRRPPANPLVAGLGPGAATFNPWVRIDGETITLITPHADIGQGATHMQALLIAEEMDLEPGQFVTGFGPPAAAYYNTAMADEVGAGISATTPVPPAYASAAAGTIMKVLGFQGTGGSSSTPDSFVKLREAGAMARETLKAAAAVETGVPVADLRTEAGQVILPDGTAIPYTGLAARAGQIAPVEGTPLRDPALWRYIGKPTQRLDIVAKSTGRQLYGIDFTAEGMLHAAVRTSPRRGRLISYDASAAEGMRGVVAIVEVPDGVAVIADNTWRAFRALDAIRFDWGPADYPAEQSEHWDIVTRAFSDGPLNAVWRNDGASEETLASGEVVEAEFRAPYVAHQPLEPLSAVVQVNEDSTDVWTATQIPRFLQSVVGGVTGHASDDVRVHNLYAGGSFGHRLEAAQVRIAAEIANRRRGVPVQLTYSREEDFAQDFPRHIAMARARGKVADGRVTALDISVAAAPIMSSQAGRLGYAVNGPDAQMAAGIWNAPYALPDFRVRAFEARGLAPVSSWRSVGASCGGFFLETFLDELIHAAGADPVAERLRLIDDPVARRVLETAADMAGWGRAPAPGRGFGVALVESFGVPVAEIVEVAATGSGIRIENVWVVADPGTVIDPVNIENHVQGAVVWGLGHAMNSEITYSDGMAQQTNYHDAEGMRLHQCPEIHVRVLEDNPVLRGIGEPPVPPAAPALANAIFALTGTRLREMPFSRHVQFV